MSGAQQFKNCSRDPDQSPFGGSSSL